MDPKRDELIDTVTARATGHDSGARTGGCRESWCHPADGDVVRCHPGEERQQAQCANKKEIPIERSTH